jgi:cytidylate kinase
MEVALKRSKVTLLFGRICSGKTSYKPNAYKVIVSRLVKGIIAEYAPTATRDQLQDTMHLDDKIAESILMVTDYAVNLYKYSEVVIDGIRQISIAEKILEHYPDAELVWLEVPVEERKRRYESREDVKDVELFEVADNKPIELECQKIFSTFTDKLTIINNY